MPWGMGEEDTGQLSLPFGSAAKTREFMGDTLEARGNAWAAPEQATTEHLQIKMENGPESSGVRTQCLHRRVQVADQIGKPRPLLSYPPSHRKDNPIERCWGILALPCNGTKLLEVEPRLAWAKSMTWTGIPPVVELSRKKYQRGSALGKKARRAVERRLERPPELPKWDILIRPVSTAG